MRPATGCLSTRRHTDFVADARGGANLPSSSPIRAASSAKMPATRKRVREAANTPLPVPASPAMLRTALATRSGGAPFPAAWRAAATAVGVSSTDAVLCHVGRSIVAALQAVPAMAEAARSELRSMRAALLVAVNARCDELEAGIHAAECAKIASLERELCAIDSGLEQWRVETYAAAEAAASLDDAEIVAEHATLSARLDAAEAQLLALPTALAVPAHMALAADVPSMLTSIAAFGQVVSPRAVRAVDLTLAAASTHALPGSTLRLTLVLPKVHFDIQSAEEELRVSLPAAAVATYVEAALEARGSMLQRIEATIEVDVPARGIAILLAIPASAPAGASVVYSVAVFGQPFACTAELLTIPVRRGIQAPLHFDFDIEPPSSFCISIEGQIFALDTGTTDLHVYAFDGKALPRIPLSPLGIKAMYNCIVFADDMSPTVLITSDETKESSTRLIAVDLAAHSVRWVTARVCDDCCGLGVLPAHGIVIVASYDENKLVACRLNDGRRVGSVHVPGLDHRLASDPSTGSIFGCALSSVRGTIPPTWAVIRYTWNAGSGFSADGAVAAVGDSPTGFICAVVPPARGKHVSHLVVCEAYGHALLVLTLPDLVLVHTHRCDDLKMVGLASDPWGEALALSAVDDHEESFSMHVLAWPLPGM